MASSPMMIRLNNIQVIYSEVMLVLKGLSLEVPEGQIVTLLGANGAGKTTTLKAISGLLKTEDGKVTDGSIEFMGGASMVGTPSEFAVWGLSRSWKGVRCWRTSPWRRICALAPIHAGTPR